MTVTKRKRPNIRAFYIAAGPMQKLRTLAVADQRSQSQTLVLLIEREYEIKFPNTAARAALL